MTEATDEDLMKAAYDLWLRNEDFKDVYPMFPDMAPASVRRKIYVYRDRLAIQADPDYLPPAAAPELKGALDELEDEFDEEEVWEEAVAMGKRTLKDGIIPEREINFDYGTVGLVFMADLHLGNAGVDYARIDREIDLILDTPGMYVVTVGDLIDNFIIGRLMQLRMNESPMVVQKEWVLVRRVMRRLAPRLIACVSGNHDNWTYVLSGVDYFQEVTKQIQPHVLYAKDELRSIVRVGDHEFRLRARHKWRGFSMYNPTHGTERGAKFDDYPFHIGVAAHTHAGGYSRDFNVHGENATAILCGTYKRKDSYAIVEGFSRPNRSTAVTAIIDDEGGLMGVNNLRMARNYLRGLHR